MGQDTTNERRVSRDGLELVTRPSEILSTPARPVQDLDEYTKVLARRMIKAMNEWDGIGLAAPQVGYSLQLAVIDKTKIVGSPFPPIVMINPEILHTKKLVPFEEGCLSIPDEPYKTERYMQVTVRYTQIDGKKITVPATGLLGICMQHEIDHLKGVIISDTGERIFYDPAEQD